MNSLSELTYQEFLELKTFINRLKDDIEDNSETFLMDKFQGFFFQLSALEMIELQYLLENTNEENFNEFKVKHPSLPFDSTGRSEIDNSRFNAWEIRLETLEEIYKQSKHIAIGKKLPEDHEHNQVIQSKTLERIMQQGKLNHNLYRSRLNLLRKKYGEDLYLNFLTAEETLKELNIKPSSVLGPVIHYCDSKKQFKDFITFLNFFFSRLDVVSKDKNLIREENAAFYEHILQISSLNN